MNKSDAYDYLCAEYLSKCEEYGCDSCIAQIYCIKNGLRHDRYPQNDCPQQLKEFLKQRKS